MIMYKTFASARFIALVLGTTCIANGKAAADFVIADDLIVQGSACVGLDCVNNESFGFDTIRLKENNTRIKFDDTSTSAGFPNNDWQLTANDSAAGGLNKFSIENTTVGTIPFTVVGPAPTNSLFVASNGKVGLRTATPGLDLHIATSDTPAQRLEQNNSGGFTAQTWDIGGNEANFFVRDVTGGSRLPFRIRPGAPTSSIDVNASGVVGIGTASPGTINGTAFSTVNVHAFNSGTKFLAVDQSGAGGLLLNDSSQAANSRLWGIDFQAGSGKLSFDTYTDVGVATQRLLIDRSGNVGIGTTAPAAKLHTTGGVRFAGVASCGSGIQSNASGDLSCLVSSRQFKNIAGDLAPNVALANVMALRPQTGSYKDTPDVPEHWLIAEDVAAVDPALIGLNDGKPHVVKTQNVMADLIVVVQQQTTLLQRQQQRIDALERQLSMRQ
jgi:hypothetical protein